MHINQTQKRWGRHYEGGMQDSASMKSWKSGKLTEGWANRVFEWQRRQ